MQRAHWFVQLPIANLAMNLKKYIFLTERFNKTLEEMIRKTIKDPKGWDQVVDEALFAYRTSKHASTGSSPFFLMYNRYMNITSQLVFVFCYIWIEKW